MTPWAAVLVSAVLASGEVDGGAASGPTPRIFIGQLDVASSTPRPLGRGEGLAVRLEAVRDPTATFALLEARTHRQPGRDGSFRVNAAAYLAPSDPVTADHLRSTFLVDHSSPEVQAVASLAKGKLGSHPGADALADFVADYITTKDLQRDYDVASVIARRREGDCTEHAVLLTALARSFGIPARIVHGVALMTLSGRVFAFGHAWVEVHDARGWRVADAAVPASEPHVVVPLFVVREEGPAFGFGLVAGTATLQIRRVLIEDAHS
jgi:transglutaminase-like putative cysteine protease